MTQGCFGPQHDAIFEGSGFLGIHECLIFYGELILQGKSRWHSYPVFVYISPVLTYLLGTAPCTLTIGYNKICKHPMDPLGSKENGQETNICAKRTFFHLCSLRAMFRYSDSLQTSARDIQFLSGSLLEFL